MIDAEFAGFGEVGDGKGGVVEQKMEETTVKVGLGEGVVLLEHLSETIDGFVDVAGLRLLEGLLE